jgi:WD40 repeat protein
LWGADGRLVKEIRGRGRAQAETRRLNSTSTFEKEMYSIARFSPDGDFVVTANVDPTVRVWDALDGTLVDELRGHRDEVNSVAFSADSKSIITASDDQTVRSWPFHREADKKNARVETWDHPGLISSLTAVFSPQRGPDVAVTTSDGNLWLEGVGPQRSVQLVALGARYTPIARVKFSPDQQSIAIATSRVVHLYKLEPLREFIDSTTSASIYRESISDEIATPTEIEFAGHTAYVRDFSFNKDGSLMVTASDDGTARVWNTTTGQTVGKLEGHSDGVNSATFSSDGKFIVTASNDKTVRIWDATSFALLRNVGDSFAGPVHSAEYNPNRDLIVVASGNAAPSTMRKPDS